MSEHRATVAWRFGGGDFLKGQYSREHSWTFDGGVVVPASPSPSIVRPPYSNPQNVDPEEAFVAAISSCHMLTFLHLASRAGFQVESYADEAVGKLSRNQQGSLWVSAVELHPRIEYGEARPDPAREAELHERAHHECFIASSVKTEITVKAP